jgi:uncharacterized repeat protein (TIGR02543 family)
LLFLVVSIVALLSFLSGCPSAGVPDTAPTYSVAYDRNNATSGDPPVDNNAYVKGETVIVLANCQNLAKTGYTFVGWNTNSDGSGSTYSGGETFTMGNAGVTRFAHWRHLPAYKVS